eukprot:bmy_06903T0
MSCHPVSPLGALWPSCICTCVSGPGFILGVPSASRCSGVCGTRFSEDLTPEETQTSWDKDIPAINQESARGGPCPHLPTCTFRGALWAAVLQEGAGGGGLLVELSPSELGPLGYWDS